jgi:hypothetical protein
VTVLDHDELRVVATYVAGQPTSVASM